MKALLLSSMEKALPDRVTTESELRSLSVLKNERAYFQLAVKTESDATVSLSVSSPLAPHLSVRRIGFVPSDFPAYPDPKLRDDEYITIEPARLPDPLFPTSCIEEAAAGEWLSFWISFRPVFAPPAGEYAVILTVSGEGETVTKTLTVRVVDACLPEQKLKVTQWFHSDSIAELHGVEVFSEDFWSLTGKYLRTATENGINMILTPIITPPLDTAVGGERLTVQLVGIEKNGEEYGFDFSLLDRWIDLCLASGVKYLEMAHLFTQWGAKACPKVMATVDGEYRRIFGWDTPALGDEYKAFLSAFLPALTAFLREKGVADITYFHLSDEPHGDEARAQYTEIKKFLAPLLEGFTIMDALSDVSFYESGAVDLPVPKNNGIEPFVKAGVKPLWTYYCCMQGRIVPNRFMAMPGFRNRIMGILAYVYDLDGFLHWGYNFYHSQYSVKVINPFEVTDAGCAFPSGDAFSVYPGKDGPLESTRLNVFHEGLSDLAALRLLEAKRGRKAVLALIAEAAGMKLTMTSYPRSAGFILSLREKINAML